MAVTLTPAAAERVKQYLADTPGGIGLSVSVRKSGCSGWTYAIDIATGAGPDDQVFSSHGVDVRVPADSLGRIDGTVIDFTSRGLNQQFQFRNPRVTGECGCGESFTTAEEHG